MSNSSNDSSELKQWRETADNLNYLLTAGLSPITVQEVCTSINNAGWNNSRALYTFAHMSPEGLIAVACQKPSIWQTALNAKACFGKLGDLRAIYGAGLEKGIRFDLDSTLHHACTEIKFCDGLTTNGSLETAEQLLQWGADAQKNPNSSYPSCSYFYRAVNECGTEMGKLFARYGVPPKTIAMHMSQNARNRSLYEKFREVYWEYGRYNVSDPETLVEYKEIDPEKSLQMKVVFNFASCRVHEIFEWSDIRKPPQINDFTFDEYGQPAVEKARQKLIELGGNPSDGTIRLRGKGSSPLDRRPHS